MLSLRTVFGALSGGIFFRFFLPRPTPPPIRSPLYLALPLYPRSLPGYQEQCVRLLPNTSVLIQLNVTLISLMGLPVYATSKLVCVLDRSRYLSVFVQRAESYGIVTTLAADLT